MKQAQAPDLAGLRHDWEQLALKLTSSSEMVTAADLEVAAGDKSFLATLASVMYQSRFVSDMEAYLRE